MEDDGAGEAEDLDLAADFGLGDQDVDDFELSGDDMAIGETMSEEDIDRLLGDDFALDETGNDDEGLSALLESMGQDDDLSARYFFCICRPFIQLGSFLRTLLLHRRFPAR